MLLSYTKHNLDFISKCCYIIFKYRVRRLEVEMSVHISERDESQMKIDCLETEVNLLKQENSRLQEKLSVRTINVYALYLSIIERR